MRGFQRNFALFAVVIFCALFSGPASAQAPDLLAANGGTDTLDLIGNGGKVTKVAQFISQPLYVVVAPDAKTTFVSLPNNNTVETIDLVTKSVTSISVPGPQKMVMNAAGSRLYVAGSTRVAVIDVATKSEVSAESIDLIAYNGNGYAIALNGGFLAVGTASNVLLFDISGSPVVLLANQYKGTQLVQLNFHPLGTKLYVTLSSSVPPLDSSGQPIAGWNSGNLHVQQVSTLAPLKVLNLGVVPLADGAFFNQYLYLSALDGIVYPIDSSSDAVATPTPLSIGGQAWGVAAAANVYVGNQSTSQVRIIRTGKNPISDSLDGIKNLPVGAFPYGIAVVPAQKGGGKP